MAAHRDESVQSPVLRAGWRPLSCNREEEPTDSHTDEEPVIVVVVVVTVA